MIMFGLSSSGLLCKQVNSTRPLNNLCEESDYRSFILAAAGPDNTLDSSVGA